jgi:hypothetical protein
MSFAKCSKLLAMQNIFQWSSVKHHPVGVLQIAWIYYFMIGKAFGDFKRVLSYFTAKGLVALTTQKSESGW